jgi:acyl carrier protein
MNQTEVIERMRPVFDEVFSEPVVLRPTLSAHDVREWDSLAHVSLVLAVEHAFGIRFRVGEVEMTRNVGELADLIAKRVPKG